MSWKRALAVGAALTLALGACGGDDDDDDAAGDDTEETTVPEDTEETTPPDGESEGAITLDQLCEEAKADGVEAPDGYRVNLVTDIGRVDDGTFNQYSYDAMEAASDCFGFETSYIETANQADYAKNINTALEGGPNIVVVRGVRPR